MINFIGTDKVAFLSTTKHGSQTLRSLSDPRLSANYDFIETFMIGEDISALDKYTILYTYRDNFECLKSGFIEDLMSMDWGVTDYERPHFYPDKNTYHYGSGKKDIKKLFKFIFNKQNASNPYIRWILATIQLHAASGHQEGYGHKHICFNDIYFFWDDIFLHDNWNGCKFYFFDMKYMSDPRLIEWISKIDDRWKDVSISHENAESDDLVKLEMLKILKELKNELGNNYLDYEDINNWNNFRNVNDFNKNLFNSIKNSKYFLDIENL